MSHWYEDRESGIIFHYNSDLSGAVTIVLPGADGREGKDDNLSSLVMAFDWRAEVGVKVLAAGRKVHRVVEDDSDDVMLVWTTGIIHAHQKVTKPLPEEIVPGFVFDDDSNYGLESESLKPLSMPKRMVAETFGITMDELQRLQVDEWVR